MELKNAIAVILILVGAIGVPTDLIPKTSPVTPGGSITGVMNPSDREWFRSIYSNMAKIVEADAGVMLSDTDKVRNWHVACLRSVWRGVNNNPQYDGVKAKVETAFKDAIGLDRQEVTPELRATLVELFKSLAKE